MPTRNKRRRAVLGGAGGLVAAMAVGGVIWSHAAGAGARPEPAALAAKGTFKGADVAKLAAESARSSLRGSVLEKGRGQSKGRRVQIGGGDEVIAAITGSLTPAAVDSSDGGTVVYSSWRQISKPQRDNPQAGVVGQGIKAGEPIGIPSVRIYTDASGKDKLIETGAYSPVLSPDGRLAFVRGDTNTVRQNVDYTGEIVVGRGDGTSFESWTTESARYYTYAWAGSTLLAYKALPESEAADLYAFTGAGQARLLAPEAFVIAISPDASRVLVAVGRRMVEVVRVKDGAIEASMPLDGDGVAAPDSATTPHALMFAGSWYGDRVVANSDVGLVVLNVRDGIRIESVIKSPEFPTGITEPTLLDDAHLIGWADLGSRPAPGVKVEPAYDNALVECDLAARSCNVGTPSPARTWTRWVINPSR
jgi:hypothetical protein